MYFKVVSAVFVFCCKFTHFSSVREYRNKFMSDADFAFLLPILLLPALKFTTLNFAHGVYEFYMILKIKQRLFP
jgi:hypothetical protein